MTSLPVFLLCKPERRNSDIPAAHETVQFETAYATGSTSASIPINRKPDFRAKVFHIVTPWVPWIAACWLLGMALLLLKTIGGVIQVRVLKQKIAAQNPQAYSNLGIEDKPTLSFAKNKSTLDEGDVGDFFTARLRIFMAAQQSWIGQALMIQSRNRSNGRALHGSGNPIACRANYLHRHE
jgi:hypothetical protein